MPDFDAIVWVVSAMRGRQGGDHGRRRCAGSGVSGREQPGAGAEVATCRAFTGAGADPGRNHRDQHCPVAPQCRAGNGIRPGPVTAADMPPQDLVERYGDSVWKDDYLADTVDEIERDQPGSVLDCDPPAPTMPTSMRSMTPAVRATWWPATICTTPHLGE